MGVPKTMNPRHLGVNYNELYIGYQLLTHSQMQWKSHPATRTAFTNQRQWVRFFLLSRFNFHQLTPCLGSHSSQPAGWTPRSIWEVGHVQLPLHLLPASSLGSLGLHRLHLDIFWWKLHPVESLWIPMVPWGISQESNSWWLIKNPKKRTFWTLHHIAKTTAASMAAA